MEKNTSVTRMKDLDAETRRALEIYRAMDDEGKQALLDLVESMLAIQNAARCTGEV